MTKEVRNEEPLICEEVLEENLRHLAAAVIIQAIDDARNQEKPRDRLEAVTFLVSPDALWWHEWAGQSFADPWGPLLDGRYRHAPINRRTGGNRARRHTATV